MKIDRRTGKIVGVAGIAVEVDASVDEDNVFESQETARHGHAINAKQGLRKDNSGDRYVYVDPPTREEVRAIRKLHDFTTMSDRFFQETVTECEDVSTDDAIEYESDVDTNLGDIRSNRYEEDEMEYPWQEEEEMPRLQYDHKKGWRVFNPHSQRLEWLRDVKRNLKLAEQHDNTQLPAEEHANTEPTATEIAMNTDSLRESSK